MIMLLPRGLFFFGQICAMFFELVEKVRSLAAHLDHLFKVERIVCVHFDIVLLD